MPTPGPKQWYQNNSPVSACCGHCKGVLRHEHWCITRNATTAYAFRAVMDSDNLSQEDKFMLHALGVCWIGRSVQREDQEQPGGILPR